MLFRLLLINFNVFLPSKIKNANSLISFCPREPANSSNLFINIKELQPDFYNHEDVTERKKRAKNKPNVKFFLNFILNLFKQKIFAKICQ